MRIRKILTFGFTLYTTIACMNVTPVLDQGDKGAIALPTDSSLTLVSDYVGVHPDKSVLEDPNNPFILTNVTEDSKWDLNNAGLSTKAKFYLWATILAKSPSGENQYYVATQLNALFQANSDEKVRTLALNAYRSLLDNFFDSTTYTNDPALGGYKGSLNNYVCTDLTTATALLSSVTGSSTETKALSTLSQWGYYCDPTNNIIIRK